MDKYLKKLKRNKLVAKKIQNRLSDNMAMLNISFGFTFTDDSTASSTTFLFYLYIFLPDLQESDGGTNT